MKQSRNSVCNRSALFVLLFTLAAFLSTGSLFAQSQDTIHVSSLNLELIYPIATLNQGDRITVEVHLGTAEEEVSDLIGYDLDISLSNDASFPSALTMDLGNSWLFPNGNEDTSQVCDEVNQVLHLHGFRSDNSGITGNGEIFRFELECNANEVFSQSLITQTAGFGTIVVENLDKHHDFSGETLEATSTFSAYPNPTSGKITFDWDATTSAKVQLYDLQGRALPLMIPTGIGTTEIDLSSLNTGIYLAIMELESGETLTKRVVKK